MPLLSTSEALHVSDSFLSSLYGDDIFRKWKELKDEMKFTTEREYVSWLIDVANNYKYEEEELQQPTQDSISGISKIKPEVSDVYDQGPSDAPDYSYYPTSVEDKANAIMIIDKEDISMSEIAGNQHSHHSHTEFSSPFINTFDGQTERRPQTGVQIDPGEILISSDDEEGDEQISSRVGDQSSGIDDTNTSAAADTQLAGTSQIEKQQQMGRRVCPHCHYTSSSSTSIRRHITAVHERHRPFPCQHCDYQCSQRSTLNTHYIGKHGYRSRHHCLTCGKYFLRPSTLQKHVANCCAAAVNEPSQAVMSDSI